MAAAPDDLSKLRSGWHHSRFEPYVKVLAPELASLPNFRGELAPRVCAEIDVGALIENCAACQKQATESGETGVVAVVKADAYGHGAAVVARVLHRHCGIGFFAVATLPEALELRAAGLDLPVRVVVLGASVPDEWAIFAKFGIELVIESEATARLLCALPGSGDALKVHVMLNTGMNRIGLAAFDSSTETHGRAAAAPKRAALSDVFAPLGDLPEGRPLAEGPPAPPAPPPTFKRSESASSVGSSGRDQEYHGIFVDEAVDVVSRVAAAPALAFVGLCTHMADATANTHRYTQRQFGRFRDIVLALRDKGVCVPMVHCENSETLLSELVGPERMRQLLGPDTAGFCRVGGALYGQRHHSVLKPVMTLKAQVRHVHRLEKGMTVGYDRSWIAPCDCLIATLAVGFADGYSRSLSNRGKVGIRGHEFTIAGKVCMDMSMVNLGPPDGPGAAVRVGDFATLWGLGGQSLADTADDLATAQSDLTCDLSRRVTRRYVNLPDGFEPPQARAADWLAPLRSLGESLGEALRTSPAQSQRKV